MAGDGVIWTLCFRKWNGGNPGWFPMERIGLAEFPKVGDRIAIEGDGDSYEVVWVNAQRHNLGVQLKPAVVWAERDVDDVTCKCGATDYRGHRLKVSNGYPPHAYSGAYVGGVT